MPFTFTYKNRKSQTYYLLRSETKEGTSRYYFSTSQEDNAIDVMPDGYEIYENPNGLVYIRKEQPKIITDQEVFYVKNGVKNFAKMEYYRVDVKQNAIIVHIPSQDMRLIDNAVKDIARSKSKEGLPMYLGFINYRPEMRFILVSKDTRLFQVERMKDRDNTNEWVEVGKIDKLGTLLRKYLKHLNKDSYLNL